MNRRKLFLGLLAGGVAGATVAPVPALACTSTGVEVYGIIRFPSSGPVVLDDANHTPKGVTGVSITSSGMLEIAHTNLVNVGISLVNPDETLVDRGIMVGNSQGFSSAFLKFRDTKNQLSLNLNTSTHYDKLEGTSTNIWFYARSSEEV